MCTCQLICTFYSRLLSVGSEADLTLTTCESLVCESLVYWLGARAAGRRDWSWKKWITRCNPAASSPSAHSPSKTSESRLSPPAKTLLAGQWFAWEQRRHAHTRRLRAGWGQWAAALLPKQETVSISTLYQYPGVPGYQVRHDYPEIDIVGLGSIYPGIHVCASFLTVYRPSMLLIWAEKFVIACCSWNWFFGFWVSFGFLGLTIRLTIRWKPLTIRIWVSSCTLQEYSSKIWKSRLFLRWTEKIYIFTQNLFP